MGVPIRVFRYVVLDESRKWGIRYLSKEPFSSSQIHYLSFILDDKHELLMHYAGKARSTWCLHPCTGRSMLRVDQQEILLPCALLPPSVMPPHLQGIGAGLPAPAELLWWMLGNTWRVSRLVSMCWWEFATLVTEFCASFCVSWNPRQKLMCLSWS